MTRPRLSCVFVRCEGPGCEAVCGRHKNFCDACFGRLPSRLRRDIAGARVARQRGELARHVAVAKDWLADNPNEAARPEQWWQR